MPSVQVLQVIVGTSSFLGFASLVAYLYFVWLSKRAERSIGDIIQGETLFNAEQVLKILSQFHDDASRLEALKTLTAYDTAKARKLLAKVKGNVDVVQVSRISAKNFNRVALTLAVFFLVLAALAFAYRKLKTDSIVPKPSDPPGASSGPAQASPPPETKPRSPGIRKILAQIYYPTGLPGTEPYKDGPFAGQLPPPPISEIARNTAEVIPEESYWIRPANQMIPAEIQCQFGGGSVGSACILDAVGRLAAYVRESCGDPPALGNKVSSGCSRASPLFNPSRPKTPLVQCCFYEDSPEARGLPFAHNILDWYRFEKLISK